MLKIGHMMTKQRGSRLAWKEKSANLGAEKMFHDILHFQMCLLLSQNSFSMTKLFNTLRLVQNVFANSQLAQNSLLEELI